MKREILNIGWALAATAALSSCDSFLEESPKTFLSPKYYFQTENQITAGVNGLYTFVDDIFDGDIEVGTQNFILLDYLPGYGIRPRAASSLYLSQALNLSVTEESTHVENLWKSSYFAIENCNGVIAGIEAAKNVEIAEDTRNKLLGEAYFLRAYNYFNLVRLYGPVPLKTKTTSDLSQAQLPLSSEEAIYEVIVTGIDEAGRQAVMSNLESKGVKAHFYFCDATNEEQVNETFAKIAQKFDSIDLLVNNVGGLGGRQRVSEMETSFMRKVMALNFDSLFFNTRAALPLLKKGTNPSIINFSTIAVTNGGGIGASVYAASKGAVQSYSRALAKDLAEFGIRVNMVSPGTIDTPFHAATDRKLVESWKDSILMKRLGDPREVADVIEFLASDKASFLTGEVIQINGGQAFI